MLVFECVRLVIWPKRLPARPSFKPIQSQYLVTGALQPRRNFSGPKRPISWTKVEVEQLRNFFSRTWPPDLVQRSKHMVIEAAVRVWNLTHFRHPGLKGNLSRAAHSIFGLVASKNKQEQKMTMVNLIPAGESFYELFLVRADLPRPTKYTSVQTRLVPQLAYPSSQSPEIRRLTPATLLFSHLVRARCRQQFPCTAQHRRDSVARWSLP